MAKNRYRWLRDSSTCGTIPDALTPVRNPAVRAAALMCTSVSLCVEHWEATRGPFELQDAMKLFSLRPLVPAAPCFRSCKQRLWRARMRASTGTPKTRPMHPGRPCTRAANEAQPASCTSPRILWPVQGSEQAVLAHGLVRRRWVGPEHTGMPAAHSPLSCGRCGHPRKRLKSSSAQ